MSTTHFTHRGRRYRLATRAETPGAAWYLEYQQHGERVRRSLETPIKSAAVAKAKVWLDAREAGSLDAARALLGGGRATTSTVQQMIDWAERTILGCSENTKRRNLNCFRLILRRTVGDGYAARPLAEVLTPATVRAWTRDAQSRSAAQTEQEAANRVLRSANSIMRQAVSLLAPRVVGHMRDGGLVLPPLDEFRAEVENQRFRAVAVREWRPPGQDVIDRTLAAWRVSAGRDRNLYVAVWLMLSCGLRIGEIAQAKGAWCTPRELVGAAHVKNHTGQIRVTPLEPYWSEGYRELNGLIALGHEHLLLEGTDTERREGVFRRISAMLRDCGWESTKTNHALRALAGCWVARERGIYGAQQFLRHSSVTITEQHYAWVLR